MIQAENPTQNQENLPPQPVVKVFGFASPNPVKNQSQTNDFQQTKIQDHDHALNLAQNSQNQANNSQQILKKKHHIIPSKFFHWWHKIAVILLTAHGLVGIWESISFMAFEFPELEHLLSIHQISSDEVNNVVAMAIIVALTTLINIFMAIRLHKVEETTAHNIDLFFATILIIGTKYFQETLIQFDLLNLFINSIK